MNSSLSRLFQRGPGDTAPVNSALTPGCLARSRRTVVALSSVPGNSTAVMISAKRLVFATRAAAKIRNVLRDEGIAGDTIGILYGGSVSGAGAREFANADGIDGALVGGASLKADEFARIVDAFA